MHIVLLGLTGAGKTTVGRLLSERLRLAHVSSGAIARAMAQDDPHTAVALDRGQMAPEEAMRHHVRATLEEADAAQGGWVLEGFPRDLSQLVCLMGWVNTLPSFFHLDIGGWTAIERLTARRRDDDNPDAIAQRIRGFERDTRPVLTLLGDAGIVDVVSAGDTPETTASYIQELVG